jgi:hypothetical protein
MVAAPGQRKGRTSALGFDENFCNVAFLSFYCEAGFRTGRTMHAVELPKRGFQKIRHPFLFPARRDAAVARRCCRGGDAAGLTRGDGVVRFFGLKVYDVRLWARCAFTHPIRSPGAFMTCPSRAAYG